MIFYKKKFPLVMIFLLLAISRQGYGQGFSSTEFTLPIEFNTGNPAPYGLPSTFITIQGRTIPVILDTGASNAELILSRHALGKAPIKFTGNQICFMSFDGKHCQPEFILPEVRIGSFVLTNVRATMMSELWGGRDKYFVATEASRNGVIGLQLLARFNILLDFPHAKITFIQPGNSPTQYDIANWITIPFADNLQTELKLNGKVLSLDWDTGAVPSIIKREVARQFTKIPCPSHTTYGATNCLRVKTSSFTTMINESVPSTWFMVQDIPSNAPFDGLVGSNFFHENIVYLNFDQQIIYVKPRQKTDISPPVSQ